MSMLGSKVVVKSDDDGVTRCKRGASFLLMFLLSLLHKHQMVTTGKIENAD